MKRFIFLIGIMAISTSAIAQKREQNLPCAGGIAKVNLDVPVGTDFDLFFTDQFSWSKTANQIAEEYKSAHCNDVGKKPGWYNTASSKSCSIVHSGDSEPDGTNAQVSLRYSGCVLKAVSTERPGKLEL